MKGKNKIKFKTVTKEWFGKIVNGNFYILLENGKYFSVNSLSEIGK